MSYKIFELDKILPMKSPYYVKYNNEFSSFFSINCNFDSCMVIQFFIKNQGVAKIFVSIINEGLGKCNSNFDCTVDNV